MLQGLSGTVAQTGEILNIPDCYTDARFSTATDLQTGYRTRSMLCMAVKDSSGEVVAVLQLLNKNKVRVLGRCRVPWEYPRVPPSTLEYPRVPSQLLNKIKVRSFTVL